MGESFQFQKRVMSISSLTLVSPRTASPIIPWVGNEMVVVGTRKLLVWNLYKASWISAAVLPSFLARRCGKVNGNIMQLP